MSRRTRVVVAGAGYAGLLAALRLSRQRHRVRMDITLVNGGVEFVERIRLHQLITGQELRRWPLRRFLSGTGINFVEANVERLDAEKQELTVRFSGGDRRLPFDRLVLATGSRPATPRWGDAGTPLLAVGDAHDAKRLLERLPDVAARDGRVAVVGGGPTGIETAAELAESYPALHVMLLTAGELGAGLSERARSHLRRVFDRLRVEVREHVRVEGVGAGEVALAGGDTVAVNLSVWAGAMHASPLASDAGLPVNTVGQLLVDPTLRSVVAPNIFAAGDVACVELPSGRTVRMACATALPLGAHAADNVVASVTGNEGRPFRFSYFIQCISLGRHDGIIQRVDAVDVPTDRVLTGRRAAWIKEQICRSTVAFLRLQRRGIGYRWPHGRGRETASVA